MDLRPSNSEAEVGLHCSVAGAVDEPEIDFQDWRPLFFWMNKSPYYDTGEEYGMEWD